MDGSAYGTAEGATVGTAVFGFQGFQGPGGMKLALQPNQTILFPPVIHHHLPWRRHRLLCWGYSHWFRLFARVFFVLLLIGRISRSISGRDEGWNSSRNSSRNSSVWIPWIPRSWRNELSPTTIMKFYRILSIIHNHLPWRRDRLLCWGWGHWFKLFVIFFILFLRITFIFLWLVFLTLFLVLWWFNKGIIQIISCAETFAALCHSERASARTLRAVTPITAILLILALLYEVKK